MTNSSFDLSGKVAIVTGGNGGIGLGIARGFRDAGASLAVAGRSPDKNAAVAEEFGDDHGVYDLDVRDEAAVENTVAQVVEHFGRLDVLVNNAGVTRDNLLMRMKEEEWDQVVSANLSSVYRVCKAALRGMIKAGGGRIINITSVVGLTGNPGQVNYSAAKAGIIGFSKSLAKEVASRNITVNTIAPGFIATDMTAGLDGEQKAALLEQIPSAKLGAPEDVAAAVIYLASDAAAYVTGETLNINGGLSMR